MNNRQLTLVAVVLVIALTPSIADIAHAHSEERHMLPLVWGWVILAAVVGLLAGERLAGGMA